MRAHFVIPKSSIVYIRPHSRIRTTPHDEPRIKRENGASGSDRNAKRLQRRARRKYMRGAKIDIGWSNLGELGASDHTSFT